MQSWRNATLLMPKPTAIPALFDRDPLASPRVRGLHVKPEALDCCEYRSFVRAFVSRQTTPKLWFP